MSVVLNLVTITLVSCYEIGSQTYLLSDQTSEDRLQLKQSYFSISSQDCDLNIETIDVHDNGVISGGSLCSDTAFLQSESFGEVNWFREYKHEAGAITMVKLSSHFDLEQEKPINYAAAYHSSGQILLLSMDDGVINQAYKVNNHQFVFQYNGLGSPEDLENYSIYMGSSSVYQISKIQNGEVIYSYNGDQIVDSSVKSLVWHNHHLYVGGFLGKVFDDNSLQSGAIISKVDSDLNPIWNFVQSSSLYSVEILNSDRFSNKVYGIGHLRDANFELIESDHLILFIISPDYLEACSHINTIKISFEGPPQIFRPLHIEAIITEQRIYQNGALSEP